ncbi:MAG: hypothetical protein JW751_08415 [Polyangiaceae bacterium]|nr:hypothetical protein [Polyangiaceae bacterium]
MTTIRDELPPFFFDSIRWVHARSTPEHPIGAKLHHHVSTLALGRIAFGRPHRQVRLMFNRAKGLSAESWRVWLAEEREVWLNLMIRMGGRTTFFPELVAEEVEPNNAGTQVADYLLWAERRLLEKGTCGPLDATGMMLLSENQDPGAATIRHYSTHDAIMGGFAPRPKGRMPDDPVQGLNVIEAATRDIFRRRPPQVEHLLVHSAFAEEPTLPIAPLGSRQIELLLRSFLQLVDTGPVYDARNSDQVQFVSDLAFLAAYLLNPENVSRTDRVSIIHAWQDARRNRGVVVG